RLARGFARRFRQRHGALGGDARLLAALGLFQLCLAGGGGGGPLRRRPVRLSDCFAFAAGGAALARRVRSWRRAAAALRGLRRRAAGRGRRLASAGQVQARVPGGGAPARLAGASRSAGRVAGKNRRRAASAGGLRPAGAATHRRRRAGSGLGWEEDRARRAQRGRGARQRADEQVVTYWRAPGLGSGVAIRSSSTHRRTRMNIVKFVAVAAVATLASPAFAQSSTPRIDQRQANQERRIEQGEKSGALNQKEAARLEKGQAHVQKMENKALADGKVTKKERARIEHAQNQQSQRIYREKHDKQTAKK